MAVHLIHDLSQEQLIVPYKPATAVCGIELAEAHEVVRPDGDSEICAGCLSWSKRNKYQNTRCAVEMSAAGAGKTDAAAGV
ncbi:MAG TPA: hypothetical protein VFA21_03835 [Pyrinomonadaceae bacterium]|jgi:hypothetical protein|nr:hypothetical protein [Pyrinomonadaceae bacterium]